jgi:hypothetical protein
MYELLLTIACAAQASVSISVSTAARYYMFIKRTAVAYQRPMLLGRNSIIAELASIGDPTESHVPYHLLLRAKGAIDFSACGALTDHHCHEISDALTGNKTLQTLTFRSENRLGAAGIRELTNGLQRNRALGSLEFLLSKADMGQVHENYICDDALTALSQGLKRNASIKVLRIENLS